MVWRAPEKRRTVSRNPYARVQRAEHGANALARVGPVFVPSSQWWIRGRDVAASRSVSPAGGTASAQLGKTMSDEGVGQQSPASPVLAS
jgi:hypothetical protein